MALARTGRDIAPFIAAMGLFAMCYLGLAVSLFPYIVPHTLTLWDAAGAPQAQAFLLIGTLFLIPIIFTYTAWSYWVFRGKVRERRRLSLRPRRIVASSAAPPGRNGTVYPRSARP